uniref:Uncharacterized protein n=1 Tax=Oryza sativa subsp. japonica TaxID=39947 RepID=Q67UU5_ORYSJ|nr:hypothetical protein [Oryza sativa Japonica Group]
MLTPDKGSRKRQITIIQRDSTLPKEARARHPPRFTESLKRPTASSASHRTSNAATPAADEDRVNHPEKKTKPHMSRCGTTLYYVLTRSSVRASLPLPRRRGRGRAIEFEASEWRHVWWAGRCGRRHMARQVDASGTRHLDVQATIRESINSFTKSSSVN